MRFRVETSESVAEYEGSFRVTDSGVLSIEPDDGNPLLLSPAFWIMVEVTDAPDAPGTRIHLA